MTDMECLGEDTSDVTRSHRKDNMFLPVKDTVLCGSAISALTRHAQKPGCRTGEWLAACKGSLALGNAISTTIDWGPVLQIGERKRHQFCSSHPRTVLTRPCCDSLADA